MVKAYTIPFIKIPFQLKIPNSTKVSKKYIGLVDLKLKEMLRKGAIKRTQPVQGKFLSNLFLAREKDGGYRPVINLKILNQFIPFLHFKMEGLSQLKRLIQLDLKNAYFSVPLDQNSRKFARFQWKGTLCEFMCMCFGVGLAPRVITKLLKIPISLLRKINFRVIIYLDDMLILSHTIREAHMSRDTVIYFLQNLGFIVNIKKSILHSFQKIEFLGMEIDSIKMMLSLTTTGGIKSCQNLSELSQESFYNSSGNGQGYRSPIIHYTNSETCKDSIKVSSITAIVCLKEKMNYQPVITLNTKSRTELTWRIEKLRFCNGRTFSQLNPQMIIQTDASLTGWGAVCNRVQTSRQWSEEERTLHINVVEILAINLALFFFTKRKRLKSILIQIDNKAALSYVLKMGKQRMNIWSN